MNIELYEAQGCHLYITLNDEFEVYGGTTTQQFTVTRDGDKYLVTIPGQVRISRFDIFARRTSTGQEWLVESGKIMLKTRHSADRNDVVSCVEYHIVKELVESGETVDAGQMIVGIPGDSAYDVARANGYEGTEAEYTEMLTKVPEYADVASSAAADALASEQSAAISDGHATESAEEAKKSEDNAAQSASDANDYMTSAAEHATSASESASDASQSATEAESHKVDAENAKLDAEQAAQAAQNALAGAEQAKVDSEIAMVEAQTAEANAKASSDKAATDKATAEQAKTAALTAQGKAEQEASKAEQNAALLGDAALKGADNAFSGNNSHSGTEVFNGAVALNDTVTLAGDIYAGSKPLPAGSAGLLRLCVEAFLDGITDLRQSANSWKSFASFGITKFPDDTVTLRNAVECSYPTIFGDFKGKKLIVKLPKAKAITGIFRGSNAPVEEVRIEAPLATTGRYIFYGCNKIKSVELIAESLTVFAAGEGDWATHYALMMRTVTRCRVVLPAFKGGAANFRLFSYEAKLDALSVRQMFEPITDEDGTEWPAGLTNWDDGSEHHILISMSKAAAADAEVMRLFGTTEPIQSVSSTSATEPAYQVNGWIVRVRVL